MTAEKTNIQKLEALLNSATNERQRKMYLALLNKAKAELAPESAPSQQKTTESSPQKTQTSTNKQARGQTAKKKAESSPPASNKTSSKKKTTSKKEKASSNNDSVVIKEEISATNKSTQTYQADGETPSVLSSSVAPSNQTKQNQESATTKAKAKKQFKKSKSSNKATSSDSKEQPYFSGVGIIRGTPYLEDEKIFVTIDEQQYELQKVVGGVSRKRIDLLKEEIEQNGSREMILRVYPSIIHHVNGTPPYQSFRLIQFYIDEERGVLALGDTPGDSPSQYSELPEEFIFRGIWRFVSYCPNPVITINRNISRLKYYKSLSSVAQKYFARAQDFPVVWDAPVEPFKYDSKRKKSEQMPCYFVQVKAIFKNGQYIVTSILSEPTLDIPRFIKSPKKNRNSQNQSKQPDKPNQLDKESESNTEVI